MSNESDNRQRLPSTDMVSAQPTIFYGLNNSELNMVLAIGFGLFVIVAIIGSMVSGKIYIGTGLGFAIAISISLVVRKLFIHFKRQKPDGYFQQVIYKYRRDHLGDDLLITHRGPWDPLNHSSE